MALTVLASSAAIWSLAASITTASTLRCTNKSAEAALKVVSFYHVIAGFFEFAGYGRFSFFECAVEADQ